MNQFAKSWNFKIISSSPHYAQSNGLSERAVGIAKDMIKMARESNQDIELYLLNYLNSLVAGLDHTPSQLMSGRNLRSKVVTQTNNLLPIVVDRDKVYKKMLNNQNTQKFYYDKKCVKKEQVYSSNEKVWLQNVKTKL